MATTSVRRARGRPRAWADKTEQNTIKSLDRAMEVLEHLARVENATLSEIAGDLDQSAATVYRILVTLAGRGLVELDPESQAWHIGPRAFLIGASYLRRTGLVERARPILRALMEETGETANLAVPRGDEVMFVSQVECSASIRAFFPPGTLSPLHASGIGKALLAAMGEADRERYLAEAELVRFTDRTLTDVVDLRASLSEIAASGFAIDDEEKTEGMRCIACAVRDWSGEAVAGLSVSGPTSRVSRAQIPALSAAVMAAGSALSAALGHPGEPEPHPYNSK
ncbi:MAG: HTH-type transcriptional regulator BhcR [Pseudomonadota bacterium]